MRQTSSQDSLRLRWLPVWVWMLLVLTGCVGIQPTGWIYTHVRFPLTENLDRTPVPTGAPPSGRVLEVKEPFSGFGIYARVDSNAIGDIARENGMHTLYFADQEIFSILGVWTTTRTVLYGE